MILKINLNRNPFVDIQEHLDGLLNQIDPVNPSEKYLICTCQSYYDIISEAGNWKLHALACASVGLLMWK